MSRNVWIAVAAVVLLVGGWFLTRPQTAPAPAPVVSSTPQPTESTATEGAVVEKSKNMVTISQEGFSPKDITIKVGEAVTWENSDSADHTVNSAVHPTHQLYQPLNLGVIKQGEKKSLTFPQAGTYKYHDHLNPSLFGSVTVE